MSENDCCCCCRRRSEPQPQQPPTLICLSLPFLSHHVFFCSLAIVISSDYIANASEHYTGTDAYANATRVKRLQPEREGDRERERVVSKRGGGHTRGLVTAHAARGCTATRAAKLKSKMRLDGTPPDAAVAVALACCAQYNGRCHAACRVVASSPGSRLTSICSPSRHTRLPSECTAEAPCVCLRGFAGRVHTSWDDDGGGCGSKCGKEI